MREGLMAERSGELPGGELPGGEIPRARPELHAVVPAADRYADWREVYDDNVVRIHRLMYGKVGNRPDAEDLTAEVFLAALGPRMLERRQVFAEPCPRVAQRLRVAMDTQDEIANRFVPAAALFENELLHRLREGRAARVVLSQHAIECFAREQTGLFLGQHRQLGIEAEFVKMFADQLEAETVQGRNTRRIDQRELFGQPGVVRVRARLFLQLVAHPLPHLGGRRLGERDHQDAIQRHRLRRVAHARQTPLHQCARLACARPGNDQHIAVPFNRAPLAVSESAHVFFVAVGFLFNTRN